MKLLIARKPFLASLALVKPSVASRPVRPILGCVKIVAKDFVSLCSNDLEMFITVKADGVTVEDPGAAAVPFDRLIESGAKVLPMIPRGRRWKWL